MGSNRRHGRYGSPGHVLKAARSALEAAGIGVAACSPLVSSAPVGPSRRRYANAAALVRSDCEPDELLLRLKLIEHAFGRRRGGQRWGARVLDLDIILCWTSPGLTVPHMAFRVRPFVLAPAARIAPKWRDPVTGLTLRQLQARLIRSKASAR
jgi:2-amino-4-hydroxy-6-hydroxymethyldihydropteridine diphosphokinase